MTRTWIIVSGSFRRSGGQDRANLELAKFLGNLTNNDVHLVGHDFEPELLQSGRIVAHRVPKPLGSVFLGERVLSAATSMLASKLRSRAIVVSNGGNHVLGQVNWVHCVHAAWSPALEGAPLSVAALSRLKKTDARRRERQSFRRARVIVANSEKTRQDLISLGVDASLVVRIYFGASWVEPPRAVERRKIGFIGALGWDRNKGLDRLLHAFRLLRRRGETSHSLMVLGSGGVVPWQRMAEHLGLREHIEFRGRVDDVGPSLDECALLVSPVRYEAYGLAVQDALTRGVPAIVTRTAGIAERYPTSLAPLLVDDSNEPEVWATAIHSALSQLGVLGDRVKRFGKQLGKRSWTDMAAEWTEEVTRRLETR